MSSQHQLSGGRFDFDDGGTYAGGWAAGRAHGHGVCTGPKGEGAYCGEWTDGFETLGVYARGAAEYGGQWLEGKRHGFGAETRGRWLYRGEWTDGLKGRYGSRQCVASAAKYDGTWSGGLQDGYGSETYADGGTFQGQWVKGMRHGYGVRSSAPFGLAAHTRRQSLRKSPTPGSDVTTLDRRPEEGRGGFVLRDTRGMAPQGAPEGKRSPFKGLLSPKTKRTSYEDDAAATSGADDEETTSDVDSTTDVGGEPLDGNVMETYMGEWKDDRRSGFGIAERSDGLKYEGEWHNNRRFGYGRTTYKDGAVERGKYRNNFLVGGAGERRIFRSPKFKERVESAVNGAHRASQIALQKADIAISRTATARGKAEQADVVAKQARAEAEIAKSVARNFAPEFQLPSEPKGFPKPKFPSDRDSAELSSTTEDRTPDFLKPDFDCNFLSPEPPPPSGSAFQDLFRNNPDRRPSNAGFLRRPSTIHLRRPSTVVEHSLVPSQISSFDHDQQQKSYLQPSYEKQPSNYHQDQFTYQQNPQIQHQNPSVYLQDQSTYQQNPSTYQHQNQLRYPQNPSSYSHNQSPYQQNPSLYHQNQSPYIQNQIPYQTPSNYYQQQHHRQYQPPALNIQQVTDDHLHHYYQPPELPEKPRRKKPAVDLTELSVLYGIPVHRPLMEEDEDCPVVAPGRRSTLPTVMDSLDAPGVVRSGSLYGGTKKTEAAPPVVTHARKNSLPDINKEVGPRVLSREAIALLSSQRREAMRREEEEALRLRANPLLYLVSPEVWDWFASQQLVILIVVINVALGLLVFKVIL
ncbi:hypothetical protein JTE90_028747 [Oedothorax gibbosus]|uniref:Junctophilin n=1 Tax=Oedothorax gibbosus TaxID=931172 RepID=A0AAV6UES8_9ARAC|nr:hypothetical protein JTE90_028747 [Oedothorax gibbosus]